MSSNWCELHIPNILSCLLKKVLFLAFQAVSYGAFGMPQFSTTQCGIDSKSKPGTKYFARSKGKIIFEKFLHNKSDEDRKIGCLFTVISPLDPTGIWTLRHSNFLKNPDVSTYLDFRNNPYFAN